MYKGGISPERCQRVNRGKKLPAACQDERAAGGTGMTLGAGARRSNQIEGDGEVDDDLLGVGGVVAAHKGFEGGLAFGAHPSEFEFSPLVGTALGFQVEQRAGRYDIADVGGDQAGAGLVVLAGHAVEDAVQGVAVYGDRVAEDAAEFGGGDAAFVGELVLLDFGRSGEVIGQGFCEVSHSFVMPDCTMRNF